MSNTATDPLPETLLVDLAAQAPPEACAGEAGVTEPAPEPRLRKPDRAQFVMAYRCAEELVGPNHKVRTIWAIVDRLDWSAFCEPIKAREGVAGRDATDPKVLGALWLYAATRGVGSARELDRLCKESDPYKWILGGLTVNYHLLASFRVGHAQALNDLFTRILATLVDKGLVKARRITQDGIRVRAAAGASSFRSEERLEQLLEQSGQYVQKLSDQIEDPARSAEESARKQAAQKRAAEDKQQRIEAAAAQIPDLKRRRDEAAKRAGNGKRGEEIRQKKLRASTTDAEARVMKMANGGFNPAYNVQLATDPESRAIVGVEVTNEGTDTADLLQPMRQQVEARTGQKVQQHVVDGGFLTIEDIEAAAAQGVELFVPPKSARNPENRGKELEPKHGDSKAILEWKKRMGSADGKEIYKQRASTSETVNADLRQHRALRFAVRGIIKVKCVALVCALAYNVMTFAKALTG